MKIRSTVFSYHVPHTAKPRRMFNRSETTDGNVGYVFAPYYEVKRGVFSFYSASGKLVARIDHGKIVYRDLGYWRYA